MGYADSDCAMLNERYLNRNHGSISGDRFIHHFVDEDGQDCWLHLSLTSWLRVEVRLYTDRNAMIFFTKFRHSLEIHNYKQEDRHLYSEEQLEVHDAHDAWGGDWSKITDLYGWAYVDEDDWPRLVEEVSKLTSVKDWDGFWVFAKTFVRNRPLWRS